MISTKTRTLILPALVLAACLAGLPAAQAGDWSQFRGPDRNGASAETGLVRSWSEEGPRELWRVALGPGYAGVAIAGSTAYTLDAQGEKEFAVALDATNGAERWRREIGDLFENDFGNGPRSTPTVDGDRLFALSSRGNLHALSAKDGASLWSIDIRERFGGELPTWAFSSSPLVVGKRVIVEVGGTESRAIATFDRESGEVLWTAHEGEIAYSSPVLLPFNGVEQLVFLTKGKLFALDLDGAPIWETEFVPQLGIKPAPPLLVPPDMIFVSASYDAGAKMVRMKPTEGSVDVETVWESRFMRNHFNGSVVADGHLFGFDKAILKSLDAATGEQAWAQRGMGKGSLLVADGLLVILSERGKLHLAEASAEAYRELASYQLVSGRSWVQPSLSEGKLYVRGPSELVCIDLRAEKGGDDA